MTTTIKERTYLPATWTLLDANGEEVVPTTIRWRLDCKTTGLELVDWTTVTPASVVSITIPASANEIQNSANTQETKLLTFQADAGTDTQITDEAEYIVSNNPFFAA